MRCVHFAAKLKANTLLAGAVDNLINRAFQGYVAVMFYVFFMEFATTSRPVELECPPA